MKFEFRILLYNYSLNPAVDIGQVEGAFIMGLGYSTSEDVQYDPTSGQLLTTDTWVNMYRKLGPEIWRLILE